MVIYYAPPEAMAGMANMTEEQKMEGMKPWQEWMENMGERLLDGGSPLMGGTMVQPGGSASPSSTQVTGYSMLEAGSMDEAKSLVDNHPHLQWTEGCSIEVLECISMN